MTRRLALMLAIAILLMVNSFAGEGGALDNFTGSDGEPMNLAEAETESAPPPAELAVARTIPAPAPRSTEPSWTDEIGIYGEDEEDDGGYAAVGTDPTPSAPLAQQREPVRTPRIGNRGNEGALERHRLGIEE